MAKPRVLSTGLSGLIGRALRKQIEGRVELSALNRSAVARLFGIEEARVTDFVVFEPANAIKFTIRRLRPSGGLGESDLFGSQQYAPLFDVEIP